MIATIANTHEKYRLTGSKALKESNRIACPPSGGKTAQIVKRTLPVPEFWENMRHSPRRCQDLSFCCR